MAQFEPHKEEIESIGSLVFIAAQKRGGVIADPGAHFVKHPISFPYLLDEDREVTKKYGVYVRMSIESINIARPATFVVDKAGTIRFLYLGSNQTDRVDVAEVLKAFREAK
ncbi:MAG: hypothetical protein JWO13_876 [Acidobacteriales bacterium]|nr:hypothetical protein [Terriglobales bacterium]